MPIVQPPSFNFQQFAPQQSQGPGFFGSIAADVIAAMQQQKENEFRLQQLAQQQAQQQALAEYYQGTLGVQNREQDRLAADQQQKIGAQRQVGQAQQAALGMGQPPTSQPVSTVGNTTQSQPPGEFKQILGGGGQAIGTQGMQAIFGGVAPENMSAAVEGVGKVQDLAPKTPELATSGKEYEFAQHLMQVDPSGKSAKFFMDNWVPQKGPQTVINNIPAKGATKFSETLGDEQAKEVMDVQKQARTATQSIPALKEAYGLVDKSITGLGANQILALARVAGTVYKPSGDRVADTQTMVKLLREQTLAYLQTRALGSGTAVSDKDREFMERMSGADITLDPAAIKRIIRVNVGSTIMKVQDAISTLRDRARDYPDNAAQLQAQANSMEKRLQPMWMEYAKMINGESGYVNGVAQRASQIPGVVLPK